VQKKIKDRNKAISQILKTLKKCDRLFIAGHMHPDGDTIGSALVFESLLRRFKKKGIDIYSADPVPKYLKFLPGVEKIKTAQGKIYKKYDAGIILECADLYRMGNIIDIDRFKYVINIDHHTKNPNYGHVNMVDPHMSSNSEQIYYIFEQAKLKLTKDEATCLYAGLVTDTGNFQQTNTTPESHYVASKLLACGIPLQEIIANVYRTKTFSSLKLMGMTLDTLTLYGSDRIALVKITEDMYRKTGSNIEETEELVNWGMMIPTVKVSVLIRDTEKPGVVKVSLRSKSNIDVFKIARMYNGGGHKNAAGCSLKGGVDESAEVIVSALNKHIFK